MLTISLTNYDCLAKPFKRSGNSHFRRTSGSRLPSISYIIQYTIYDIYDTVLWTLSAEVMSFEL